MLTNDRATGTTVHGDVRAGFEGVREAFAQVVGAQPQPTGQQLAVYRNGERLVDLWAGPGVDGDTLTGVFSVSKGAAHLVVAMLVQDGVLDLDRAVAAYWPEFGQAGKERITLRQLLAHQAGVIGVDEVFTVEELADDRLMAERLAAQAPYWEPGTAFGYHGLVIAALTGEVVRRATGRTLQDWWEGRVRRPYGVDFYLGLPEELEPRYLPVEPAVTEPAAVPQDAGTLLDIAFSIRHLPDLSVFPNSRRTRALGQASAGGVASARGVAGAYAAVIGALDDRPALLTPETTETFSRTHSEGIDRVGGAESRFALGFQVFDQRYPVLGPDAFGHGGAAGALAFASPRLGIAYAYVRNRFALGDSADKENTLLIEEVVSSVARTRP
ncbi:MULTISPECIES: serine hydrolase domain-containing protein [Streptomyces]|uniref:Serine hydrolase domain-containing protein n=1 Tax=Streptomyces flavovirens TaxID=52258 RepID=A0ABV8N4P9_9ACTN|nr:serine hydrolase domain-containing protein [Streptomyces sp. MBT51]MBK3595058.1 beta-lactamase family protein [Streptomyces sp. MBT51]